LLLRPCEINQCAEIFKQNITEKTFMAELASVVRLCQLAKLVQDSEIKSGKIRPGAKMAHESWVARPDTIAG